MCPVFNNLLTNIDIHHCFVEFAALPGYTDVTTCVNMSSQDERSLLQRDISILYSLPLR